MNRTEELMVITMEECGELIQACSKILRHAQNPDKLSKWQESLVEEVGDVLCMIELMTEAGFLDHSSLETRKKIKRKKLHKYSGLGA